MRTEGDRRRKRRLAFLCVGFLLSLALGGTAAVAVRQHLAQQAAALCLAPSSWAPRGPAAAEVWQSALARLDASDNAGAAAELRRVAALAPDFVLARAELAHALAQGGLTAEARDTARFAFESAGGLPEQQRMAVEAEYRAASGEPERAAALWGTLFDLFPAEVRLGARLASVQSGDARRKTLQRLQQAALTPVEASVVDWVAYAVAFDDGVLAAADAALDRIADRGRQLGLPTMVANARFEQAAVALEREDTDAADRLHALAMRAGEGTEWAWRAAKDRAITLRFDRPQSQVAGWLQQAVDAARRSGDSRMLADVLWDMAPLQLSLGHLAEAEAAAQEAEALDRPKPPEARSRGPLSRMYEWREQARLLFARGALGEASRRVAQAVEENVRVENKGFRVLPFQAEVLRAQGRSERAADLLAGAINEKGLPSFIQGRVLVQRANAQLDLGRTREAAALLAAAAPMHRTRLDESWTALVNARLLRLEGKPTEARLEAVRAVSLSESNGFFEPAVLSQVELGRAEAALRMQARPRLQKALARAVAAGHVPLQLEAQLALGQVEAAQGLETTSRATLGSVLQSARNRGFGRIAAEASRTLKGLSVQLASVR